MRTRIELQLICYLGIGASATLAEWVLFYIFSQWVGVHYAVATTLAFIFSTSVNWVLGRLLIFKQSERGWLQELFYIYSTSMLGLGFNLMIMFVLVEKMSCTKMFSKVIATGVVFFWNFGVRKLFIYKK